MYELMPMCKMARTTKGVSLLRVASSDAGDDDPTVGVEQFGEPRRAAAIERAASRAILIQARIDPQIRKKHRQRNQQGTTGGGASLQLGTINGR